MAIFLVLLLYFVTQPATGFAQSGTDQTETGILGEPQVIEADVGDYTELSEISLFHRFGGEREYRSMPMSEGSQVGIYTASVATAGVETNQLEFYILAEAVDGDTLLKGSAFDPIVRTLTSSAPDDLSTDEPTVVSPRIEATSNWPRYVYIGLGVLAVGAIAAATSGGDDGGSQAEPCGADGCDLTLELPNP